jgi:hypothetical protein
VAPLNLREVIVAEDLSEVKGSGSAVEVARCSRTRH